MPFDILGFIIILVVSFFAIMYFGKSLGVSAILSLYPTLLIYDKFPYLEKITSYARNETEVKFLKAAIFTFLLLLIYIMMRRAVSVVFSWTPLIKLFEAIVLGIILTGFLILSYTHVTELTSLIKTPPLTYILSGSATTLFWWLFGSIIVLFLTLKR